jgi:predicted phosphodiesterase
MKTIKFILLFALIIFCYSSKLYSNEQKSGTRFVVAGHLYPITKDQKKLNKFADKINSHNPDYVFILGDSDLQNKEIYDYFNTIIESKIFFSPGNNELRISKDNYIKNVGYLNKVIVEKDIKFILMDSSDSKENIINFLEESLKDEFQNGPTILLTHHRIWDDTIIDPKPYMHDKSYYLEDIYSTIKDKVNFIFSGNSKRQYFRDLVESIAYGKQNVNLIYWTDKIEDIEAYSVGMGNGVPKATFVVVDTLEENLLIKGDYSTDEEYVLLPKNLIQYNKRGLSLEHTSELKDFVKKKFFLVKREKAYIAISIILLIILSLIILLMKSRRKNKLLSEKIN